MEWKLYEIGQAYRAALESIQVDPETGEVLDMGSITSLAGAFDEKADAVACYIKELAAMEEGIKKEKQAVGSPVQLAEWGRMEETAFQSVVASNFQRAFRARSQQQREQDKLPNSLRQLEERMAAARALLLED